MPERKVFADSIIPLPQQPVVAPLGLLLHEVKPEHRQEKMTLLFSLAPSIDAQQVLEEKVASGEIVAPGDLEKYSVDPAKFDPLVSWLEAQGFEIVHTTPDRTSVYAKATVDTIEKSLGVEMVRVTKDGLTYSAARNAPSLPLDGVQEELQCLGYQDDHRDMVLSDRAKQDARLPARGVDDARAAGEGRQRADGLLQHMTQREKREQAEARIAGEDVLDAANVA